MRGVQAVLVGYLSYRGPMWVRLKTQVTLKTGAFKVLELQMDFKQQGRVQYVGTLQ